MNVTIQTTSATITPSHKMVDVELNDIEPKDLLDHVSVTDVIRHFDERTLLNEIGIDAVKDYFDLIERE
jgi:hypothetical protein